MYEAVPCAVFPVDETKLATTLICPAGFVILFPNSSTSCTLKLNWVPATPPVLINPHFQS